MSRNETAETVRSTPAGVAGRPDERVAWVDYAKGICILLVCMMHSTLGVGEAMHGEGFMHQAVAWARPFRMPDFFLLSGLFVAHVIDRPWRTYLDRKVVHFVYFYVLWLLIQWVFRFGPQMLTEPMKAIGQLGWAAVYPFPPLWFIYVLPLYFVAVKALRGMPLWGLIGIAALIHTVPIRTGWPAIDVFAAHYFVFFLIGYAAAPYVFALAEQAARHVHLAVSGLAIWAVVNTAYAFTPTRFAGYAVLADLPVVSIAVGLLGAGAVVTTAALLARFDLARIVRYCGQHSLVIYVCFMLPMAITRTALVKTKLIGDVGIVSVLVILAAVTVPLVLHRLVRTTRARFLFERPAWASIDVRRTTTTNPTPRAATVKETAPPAPRPTTPPVVARFPQVNRLKEKSAMPRTTPRRIDRGHRLPPRGSLPTPANQNTPEPAAAEPVGGEGVTAAHRLTRFAELRARVANMVQGTRDVIAGKPEVIEPAVIVSPAPDRLAKALRRTPQPRPRSPQR